MQKEIWKDVKGYENLYQVSNLGNVKRLNSIVKYSNNIKANHKERVLKFDETKGYNRVALSKNNKVKRVLVHRLVALTFLQNEFNKPCVNHKDGNKLNNQLINLEWCTYSENENHSYNLLNKINHNRKLNNNQISDIRKNVVKNFNTRIYADKYNVTISTILNVLNGKYYIKGLPS